MSVSVTPLPLLFLVLSCTGSLALNCSHLQQLRKWDAQFQARGDKFVDFDWELSKELNNNEKGNIVISPISLKVLLAMLYEGAKGETAREIADALDLNLDNSTSLRRERYTTRERFTAILKSLQMSKGDYKIKMGTHIFIDEKAVPKENFQCKVQHYYNSDMEKVNFSNPSSAVKTINNWASNATEGHIQDLLSESDAHTNTIMLLLNAVYFKGKWQVPFPLNQTRNDTFYLNEKDTVQVPMMRTSDKFGYIKMTDLKAHLVRLPYLGDKFAMYVLLPESKTGLNKIIKALGPEKPLMDYITNMTLASVNLALPKFEYDYTTGLRESLEKLNIKTMFTPEADLSEIAKSRTGSLVVSNVLQKAGISVTEVGTVAYAATAVELMDKFGGDNEHVDVTANRPFLFFIQDETVRTTVFVGKVTNPEKVAVTTDKANTDAPNTTKIPQNTPAPYANSSKPAQNASTISPEATSPHSASKPGVNTSTDKPAQTPGTINSTLDSEERFGSEDDAAKEKFNNFDATLLEKLGAKESGNFVISPASIKMLLALLIEGAEGQTLDQMMTVMGLPANRNQARPLLAALQNSLKNTVNSKVTIDSVSQLFVSTDAMLNTTYKETVKAIYETGTDYQDFSMPDVAANYINSWITTRTRGLIPSIIDTEMVTPDTLTVLISALYFDGKWKIQFKPEDTKPECFYSEPSMACQTVSMMSKRDELLYKYDTHLDSHVVKIPYEDDRFSMVIVLPTKMESLRRLTTDSMSLTFPKLLAKMIPYDVQLKMPSFTMEYGTDLIDLLMKVGIRDVFSDNAKLPHILYRKMGRVSAMVHKAKIEVSEKGTKAAAVTGASVVPLMFGLESVEVVLNHPFCFFIYDKKSEMVLFEGRVSSIDGAPVQQTPESALVPLQQSLFSPDQPQPDVQSPGQPVQSSNSKPNVHGVQNYNYIPSTPPPAHAHQTTEANIHFPSSSESTYDKNYIKYKEESKKRPQ